MTMPEDVGAQTGACWRTIATVLSEARASLSTIVRATHYVTDSNDAEAVLAVCGRVLAEVRPAATILVVAGMLRPEMEVEIEVTAALV